VYRIKEFRYLSSDEGVTSGIVPMRYLEATGYPAEVGVMLTEDVDTGEHHTTLCDAEQLRMVEEAYRLKLESFSWPCFDTEWETYGWPEEW
jgi:hypothetical protein